MLETRLHRLVGFILFVLVVYSAANKIAADSFKNHISLF